MTVVLVGVALIVGFVLGAPIGFFAYHFGRMGVNRYLPIYKANDNDKKRSAALAQAAKMQAEVAAMQTEYLSGLQLDRESYLAGVKK